jgi:hypothetical protein
MNTAAAKAGVWSAVVFLFLFLPIGTATLFSFVLLMLFYSFAPIKKSSKAYRLGEWLSRSAITVFRNHGIVNPQNSEHQTDPGIENRARVSKLKLDQTNMKLASGLIGLTSMRNVLKTFGIGVFGLLLIFGASVAWNGIYIYRRTPGGGPMLRFNRCTGSVYRMDRDAVGGWSRVGAAPVHMASLSDIQSTLPALVPVPPPAPIPIPVQELQHPTRALLCDPAPTATTITAQGLPNLMDCKPDFDIPPPPGPIHAVTFSTVSADDAIPVVPLPIICKHKPEPGPQDLLRCKPDSDSALPAPVSAETLRRGSSTKK